MISVVPSNSNAANFITRCNVEQNSLNNKSYFNHSNLHLRNQNDAAIKIKMYTIDSHGHISEAQNP